MFPDNCDLVASYRLKNATPAQITAKPYTNTA